MSFHQLKCYVLKPDETGIKVKIYGYVTDFVRS